MLITKNQNNKRIMKMNNISKINKKVIYYQFKSSIQKKKSYYPKILDVDDVVQLDTVIFKDENVEIRDETNITPSKSEENNGNESEVTKNAVTDVNLEKSNPIDDLQLAWEHLELSRKIYN